MKFIEYKQLNSQLRNLKKLERLNPGSLEAEL